MSVARKVQPIVAGAATASALSQVGAPSAPALFSAITHREADRAVVMLGGELDLASLTLLVDCLAALGPEINKVVLDFGELDFIDCCGLHVIVDIAQSLAASRGSLSIRSMAPQVRRVLEFVNAIAEAGLPPATYSGASATSMVGPHSGRAFDHLSFQRIGAGEL
jgi:anti-anti-sigma factor